MSIAAHSKAPHTVDTTAPSVAQQAQALLQSGEGLAESFGRAYAAFLRELAANPPVSVGASTRRSVGGWVLVDRKEAGITDEQADAARRAIDEAYVEAFGEDAEPEPIVFDDAFIGRVLQNRIRTTMKQQGLTQKQVAGQLGMDPAQFSRLLKRPQASSVITLARIATHLGLPASRLLEGLETAAAASPSPSSAA